jgi:hypothetical protein
MTEEEKIKKNWIQTAAEFIADNVRECCGLANLNACRDCTFSIAALVFMRRAGMFTPDEEFWQDALKPFRDATPGGDVGAAGGAG